MRDTLHLSQGISHRQTPLWQRDLASKMTDDRVFSVFFATRLFIQFDSTRIQGLIPAFAEFTD